jgi:hemolysin III
VLVLSTAWAVPVLAVVWAGALVAILVKLFWLQSPKWLSAGGAVVYALRRSDPFPRVFGYHELFHVLTVAATACGYVAIVLFVLPRAQ